jgi:hypothetical protein
MPLRRQLLGRLAMGVGASFISACQGGTFTGPSPTETSRIGMQCALAQDGYQCAAWLEDGPGRTQDLTGLATWSTSDPTIATVNRSGFVSVLRAGNVNVRASYGTLESSMPMQVQAGGARRDFRTLGGFVSDAATGTKLSGVTVAIVEGPNTGRTTITSSFGDYQLYDLQPGTFKLRFTLAGYAAAERVYLLPGIRFNVLDVELTP